MALEQAGVDRDELERQLAAAWEHAVDMEAQLGQEASVRVEFEHRHAALVAHHEALALRVEELIAARQAAESARDHLAARLGEVA